MPIHPAMTVTEDAVLVAAILIVIVITVSFVFYKIGRTHLQRRLRMAAAAAAQARRYRRRQMRDEAVGRALAIEAEARRTRRPVILWVDSDDKANAEMARRLDERGYRVIPADNGRKALAVLQGTKPDVMVCNVDLREISGLQLLDVVREDIVLSGMAVMLLSGRDSFSAQMASRAGADGFLRVPCQPSDVLEQLRFLLQE